MKKVAIAIALSLTMLGTLPTVGYAESNKNMKISKLGGDIAALMVCGDRRAEKELGKDWEIIKRELVPIFKKYSGKNAAFDKSYDKISSSTDKITKNLVCAVGLRFARGFVVGTTLKR
jgi:hypothetical protein